MSYIGNSPGVSSQRVVTEEVISGSPKSAFYPVGGYALGYVDVLINGLEVDSSDFTATDGVVVTLGTAAAVGDTVKIKAYIPRGLSDGYLKAEADAKYVAKAGGSISGNLAVNQSAAPVSSLDVNGNVTIANGGGYLSNVYYNSGWKYKGNGPGLAVYQDGAGTTHTLTFPNNTSGADAAATGTQRTYLDINGNLSLDTGNLVLASGKGIDFSAGSNASGMTSELLDDYETGTWVPSFIASGGGMNVATYMVQNGRYAKVGKLVTLTCHLATKNVTAVGTGTIQISGLPFSASSSMPMCTAYNGYTINAALKGGYLMGGQSVITVCGNTSTNFNSGISETTTSMFASGAVDFANYLSLTFNYYTD